MITAADRHYRQHHLTRLRTGEACAKLRGHRRRAARLKRRADQYERRLRAAGGLR